MKLSEITEKTDVVKMFVKRLASKTKQTIISTSIGKVERITGVSARSVVLSLSGGQTVKFSIRIINDQPDIFRVLIGARSIPLVGGFDVSHSPSFNVAVDAIAADLTRSQPAFEKRQQKAKVAVPKSAMAGTRAKSKPQQIKALSSDVEGLVKIVQEKTSVRDDLAAQLVKLEASA